MDSLPPCHTNSVAVGMSRDVICLLSGRLVLLAQIYFLNQCNHVCLFFFHPPGTLELVFCRIHLIFFFFISLPFCAHLCWDWFDSTWWVGLGFSQPDHNTAVRCHKKLSWLKLVMLKDFCLVQKQVMGFVWDNSLRSNRCYLSTKSFSVFFSASQASIFSSSFLHPSYF